MSNSIPETPATPVTPATRQALQVVVDDCWNRIGVTGDASCPELKKHVHCRNCPVYAAAGAQLLERSLTHEYRQEWAVHFARPKRALASGTISVLLFRIGAEWLALPSSAFQEVAEMRKIHSIPHRRHGPLLGLVNVRGELLLCVSLAKLLGLTRAAAAGHEQTVYERLLVARWDSQRVVFPADEVYGIQRFEPDQLREPPATLSKSGTSYTKGVLPWRDSLAGWLDADLLFPALNQSLK